MDDSTAQPLLMLHHGGCHCRRVRFEVDAPATPEVLDCNCSICKMTGFLHLIVPASRFRLLSGADDLEEYTFNTGAARHLFCKHCGIKSFYVPRSHPHGFSVNVRCLDAGSVDGFRITPFDDNDRDVALAAIAQLCDPGQARGGLNLSSLAPAPRLPSRRVRCATSPPL